MPPILLYSVEQLRAIERLCATRRPEISLMQRAGEATAKCAIDFLDGKGGRILVLAGPGNNGGDAWVAARALQATWHRVTVIDMADPQSSLAEAANIAREAFLGSGGKRVREWPDGEDHDLLLDGLLGIGISRPAEGALAALIERANASGNPILAIDVPSGLCADTGMALGSTIRAKCTLTFIGAKPGLYTAEGRDYSGRVETGSLGIDSALLDSPHSLLTLDALRVLIPKRLHNSHKGSFGATGVIGGAPGMLGAAVLAARAALHLGAGRVYLAALDDAAPSCDMQHPEIMIKKPRDLLARTSLSALVIGPGMGESDTAKNFLVAALKSELPLVIDADALNLLAAGRALQNQLVRRTATTLLTPHPGEAARLLQRTAREIQSDRIGAACTLARKFNCLVLLKGSGSVIANAQGGWHINGAGNPGMAAAGMGDILSGMLGALLAQGLAAEAALKLGACLHGAAADACVREGRGPAGLTASELLQAARKLLNS
jgi:hydroxyethylthiazole kinase-like uncharacterized protein yjeF